MRTKVALASLLSVALLLVGGGGVLYASDAARRARASVPSPHVSSPSLDLAITLGPPPSVPPPSTSPAIAADAGVAANAATDAPFDVPGWFELNAEIDKPRGYDISQGVEPGEVLLTFDDGPNPESTPRVLDALARRHWRAIFFTVGWRYDPARAGGAEGQALLRRIADAGHTIGNHSMTHPHLSALSANRARWEIDHNAELIEQATGRRTTLFRPPFGDLPRSAIERLRERRNGLVMWTLDVRDWASSNPTEISDETIRLLRRHRRGIVLLHDSRPSTAASVEQTFTWLEREEREGRIRVLDPQTYLSKLVAARGVVREPLSNAIGSRLGRTLAPAGGASPRAPDEPSDGTTITPPTVSIPAPGGAATAPPAAQRAREPGAASALGAPSPSAPIVAHPPGPPRAAAPRVAAPRVVPPRPSSERTEPSGGANPPQSDRAGPPSDEAPESEMQDIETGASAPDGDE